MHRALLTVVLLLSAPSVLAYEPALFPEACAVVPLGELSDALEGGGRGPVLVALPALRFLMGSRRRDPIHQRLAVPHAVELSPFAIGKYEVTAGEFAAFLNDDPGRGYDPRWLYMLAGDPRGPIVERDGRFIPAAGGERRPVRGVTWLGARMYCEWLSARTGRAYDLPTAAQWEAAARAGGDGVYPWGDEPDPSMLRFCRSGVDGPADAGSYPPNAWGVHDMLGNVWEWIADCFELDFYLYSPQRDPLHRDDACPAPEIRGGSFRDREDYCHPGYRVNLIWNTLTDGVGFRVARSLTAGELEGF